MVKELNKSNFNEVINQDKLVMVDFWASWCGPCRMLKPVMEKISQTMSDKVEVCSVDTESQSELAIEYNITSIPCVIYFRNGQPLRASLGFRPIENFAKEIEELLGK